MCFAKLSKAVLTCLVLLSAHLISAQAFVDFEDGNIDQWQVQEDGVVSLDPSEGNPGNSLKIHDLGSGTYSHVIATTSFIGDHSAATLSDSIIFDLRISADMNGTWNSTDEMVQLYGPGGTAVAFLTTSYALNNTWFHCAIPYDPTLWTLLDGTWAGLLDEVQLIRIRTEFTDTYEDVWLDNVGLTFSPVGQPLDGDVCSDWAGPEGLDGWSYSSTIGTINATLGNPPGSLQLDERSGFTNVVAPPRFRGNWSAFEGGFISFDLLIETLDDSYLEKNFLIRLQGPGGSATIQTTDEVTGSNVGTWRTYVLPIDPDAWEVATGSWDALIEFVSEVRLEPEFFTGSETVYLDRFCLRQQEQNSVAEGDPENLLQFYPVPFNDRISIRPSVRVPSLLHIIDGTGRTVLVRSITQQTEQDLSHLAPGVYTALITTLNGQGQCTVLVKL